MKPLLAPILILGLLICAALLFVQHHHYQSLYERQDRAIALVQGKYDALLRESQAAKQAEGKRQLSQAALAKARALASHYDALNHITGYTKKTASRN